MSLLTRWRNYARQYGVWGLLSHIASRAVQRVWQRSSLVFYLHEGPCEPVRPKVELCIAPLRADMATNVPWFEEGWQERWSRGDICYAAYVNGTCVHTSWVTRVGAPLGEVHQWLELDANEAYIYDCYTDGNYRGKRIFPAVLSSILQTLFADGVARVWIAAEAQNHSSARAILTAGFGEAGRIEYRKLVKLQQVKQNVLPGYPWPRFRSL